MIFIAKWVLSWVLRNCSARVYSSPIPLGRRIGGKDIPELPDLFVILHVEVKHHLLVFGYFQTT